MKKTVIFMMLLSLMCACSKNLKVSTLEGTDIEYVCIASGDTIFGFSDNAEEKKHPAALFDAPDSLMAALGLQDGVASSVRAYIIKEERDASSTCVLIDAGLGEMANGQILNQLSELQLSPDMIEYVFLTHMHGDHIGGLISNGAAVFKNAELWLSADEFAFWNKEENTMQQVVFQAYANNVHLFNPGDELPLGIEGIAAPGHTPGHVAFRYGDVMIIGDAIHGWDLQNNYPEYSARYDMDKEQAVETRKALLKKCREEHLLIGGMHLPKAFEN